jgi:hypothetical protein
VAHWDIFAPQSSLGCSLHSRTFLGLTEPSPGGTGAGGAQNTTVTILVWSLVPETAASLAPARGWSWELGWRWSEEVPRRAMTSQPSP